VNIYGSGRAHVTVVYQDSKKSDLFTDFGEIELCHVLKSSLFSIFNTMDSDGLPIVGPGIDYTKVGLEPDF